MSTFRAFGLFINMAKPIATVAKETLRQLLAERSMSIEDLAAATGMPVVYIKQHIATQPRGPRAWKIEKALKTPIWTNPIRFSDLRRASDFVGADFVLTGFHALRRAAVAKGVRNTRTLSNKDALLARVLGHLGELEAREITAERIAAPMSPITAQALAIVRARVAAHRAGLRQAQAIIQAARRG